MPESRSTRASRHVHDKYTYPRIADVLRVTIAPATDAMTAR